MKVSPVTGEEIPDETATVEVYHYRNPRPAEWPTADFIIGNPPYIGNWRMRLVFGDGYVEGLRSAYPEVPQSSDYVLYWWHRAAERVCSGDARRFGLITTNSISQSLGRRVVERSLLTQGGRIAVAIPDHPWVNTEDGAAVRVAMTVGEKGQGSGQLLEVIGETQVDEYIHVELLERRGPIHANLRIGADVASAVPLRANDGLSSPGVKLHGAGFIVTPEEARRLGLGRVEGLERHLRPYRNGRNLTSRPRGVLVIDLFGLTEEEVRRMYPEVFQWVSERVKPEREQNNRPTYRESWWIFGEPRSQFRPALERLTRFIANS